MTGAEYRHAVVSKKEKILALLARAPWLTASVCAARIGVTLNGAQCVLKALSKAGLVESRRGLTGTGCDRAAKEWRVKPQT